MGGQVYAGLCSVRVVQQRVIPIYVSIYLGVRAGSIWR